MEVRKNMELECLAFFWPFVQLVAIWQGRPAWTGQMGAAAAM